MPLFIVVAVICMYALRDVEPVLAGRNVALLTSTLVGIQILLVIILALLLSRLALKRLAQPADKQVRLPGIYRQLNMVMHIVLMVMFAGDIYLAGWADLVICNSLSSFFSARKKFHSSLPGSYFEFAYSS